MTIPLGFPCPLKTLTGLDCPLCGATRATFALLRGDVAAAFDFNALYVIVLPVVVAALALWFVRRRPPTLLTWARLPAVALAVGLVYMAVRNLPFAPFDYLGT